MLSFSKIVTLSAVAFGALTQALPVQRDAGIEARSTDLIARCGGGCSPLATVFVDLKADLDVKLKDIVDLTVDTYASVDIDADLKAACGLIDAATVKVKALVGLDINAVLKDESGVELTLDAVVALVSAVVDVVFKALLQVQVVVTDCSQLLVSLCAVVNSISALLVAVVDLTKVCFQAKIGVCIEALLKVDVVVKVLAFLKLSIVIA